MKPLVERCWDIWESIRRSPAQVPSRVSITPDHVDEGEKLKITFQPDEHYFQVCINEMYLTYSREWFNKYDPMVFVVSEFIYDKRIEAVPFIAGPKIMKKYEKKIPEGMVFSDTRVAGLHPYRGGRLTLSVVLCRVQRRNYARQLLQMVESAASVLDFSTSLSTYVKVASVILDGVEALLGLGDTDPLIGLRKEFDPDAGDGLAPGYFALIDMPDARLDTNKLWVRERQLVYGSSLADAKPFRDADFVLYSITQTTERSDAATLPFYQLWERVAQEAAKPKEDNWQSAKANMLSLYQTLKLSPDLTHHQADNLTKKYIADMKRLHENAVDLAELGPEEEELSDWDLIRKHSVSILEM
ncbi:MAG: hypothetical protein ACFFCW_36010 [Candidatus Hodarchaeota archaeon]